MFAIISCDSWMSVVTRDGICNVIVVRAKYLLEFAHYNTLPQYMWNHIFINIIDSSPPVWCAELIAYSSKVLHQRESSWVSAFPLIRSQNWVQDMA